MAIKLCRWRRLLAQASRLHLAAAFRSARGSRDPASCGMGRSFAGSAAKALCFP